MTPHNLTDRSCWIRYPIQNGTQSLRMLLEDALAAVRVDIRALRYINTTQRELGEGFTRHVARQVRIADCP